MFILVLPGQVRSVVTFEPKILIELGTLQAWLDSSGLEECKLPLLVTNLGSETVSVDIAVTARKSGIPLVRDTASVPDLAAAQSARIDILNLIGSPCVDLQGASFTATLI